MDNGTTTLYNRSVKKMAHKNPTYYSNDKTTPAEQRSDS